MLLVNRLHKRRPKRQKKSWLSRIGRIFLAFLEIFGA